MTKHLAVEWGERGIRLMCVAPGPIEDTEGYNRLGGYHVRIQRGWGGPGVRTPPEKSKKYRVS